MNENKDKEISQALGKLIGELIIGTVKLALFFYACWKAYQHAWGPATFLLVLSRPFKK